MLHAYFDDSVDLRSLLLRHPAARASAAPPPDRDILKPADPIAVGTRFLVVDPGTIPDERLSRGRHVLSMPAAGAFGSGRHDTTQLVVEALESLDLRAATILDVGCGSGIVAEAARLLGAPSVFGCDISIDSLDQARRNFSAIPLFLGSADSIASASVDIVIANITTRILNGLSAELARVAKPGGLLILSGFTHHNPPSVFCPVSSFARNEWLCWLVRSRLHTPVESAEPVQPFNLNWW